MKFILRRPQKENAFANTASIKYYNMETVSLSGFCSFCKNNIPLLIAVTFTLFFTYGIRLFWHSTGIDTEFFMEDKGGWLKYNAELGRWGLAILSKLWYIKEFNPFTAFFAAFCLIWFFTISWCYIIAIFSKNTGRNNNLIPFALVFMTMPVWGLQFYFIFQAMENAFIVSLCPYVIYILYKGLLDNEKGKVVCAASLFVFMISVYQAIIPMFFCGALICFLLLQEHSDYKPQPQVFRKFCYSFLLALSVPLIIYSIIDRIVIPDIFHIEKHYYLENMDKWGHRPIVENLLCIWKFARKIAIQNVLLVPVAVLFIFRAFFVMRSAVSTVRRRLLYMLIGIGIPLSIMFLSVLGGNCPPIRSMYVMPLAFAFMFWFLIKTYTKKAALIVFCLALFTAAHQAQITAQLFYSDQLRYNEDVRFAFELNKLIVQVQPANRQLPVVLVGKYQIPTRFRANFLAGEVIGHSMFGWNNSVHATSIRGLAFMESLGMYFDRPTGNQKMLAFKEAKQMPAYPHPDCVKRMPDFIVVRISETLYD